MKTIIIIILSFLLSGCLPEEIIYVEGFDNYRIGQSSVSLVCFPPLDLEKDFNYKEAEYYYENKETFPLKSIQKTLIYFTFEENEYISSKEYIEEKIVFQKDIIEYNNYYFNIIIDQSESGSNNYFPYIFQMVIYNDDNNIIFFLGFHATIRFYKEQIDEDISSFEGFLDKYFGEYYDFSK